MLFLLQRNVAYETYIGRKFLTYSNAKAYTKPNKYYQYSNGLYVAEKPKPAS